MEIASHITIIEESRAHNCRIFSKNKLSCNFRSQIWLFALQLCRGGRVANIITQIILTLHQDNFIQEEVKSRVQINNLSMTKLKKYLEKTLLVQNLLF